MNSRKLGTLATPLAVLFTFLLSSCSSVPVTGRRQINTMDDAKVVAMTIPAFEQMKAQIPRSKNLRYDEMVQRVGERISQQVFADQPLAEWEFVVFAPQEVNAFAMPGGKVGVFEGIFQICRTEDELAAVIAHEIAHVTARHTHERLSQMGLLQMGGTVLQVASVLAGPTIVGGNAIVDTSGMIMGIYGMGASGAANSWDRGKESEADHIGLFYMARAGYDPQAAITVMERMVELEAAMAQTSYNSTHPSSVERLDQLHGLLPDAQIEYEKAKEFVF